LARQALEHIPGVRALMRIPPEALDYFTHPTFYTCNNTLCDLEGSGLRCPSFAEYGSRLLNFMRAHPEIGSSPMA